MPKITQHSCSRHRPDPDARVDIYGPIDGPRGPRLSKRSSGFFLIGIMGSAGQFMASLRVLAGLNFTAFDGAIVISSPVRGLRPTLAFRSVVTKLPKPAIRNSSFFSGWLRLWQIPRPQLPLSSLWADL